MFPVTFRQNQTDELAGGFIDYNVSEVLPSGFVSDDGSSDDRDTEGGGDPDRES